MPLSINHYLNNLHMLADQWNPYNYKEPNRQRIYLKDIDCPQVWHDKLREQIPPGVFYLNDSTGDIGGPGSVDEPNQHGLGIRKGKGAARAGDLMSCLPPAMRAENMMCYIGHEGTYTPAHREMCASLGQNIMVEASGTTERDGMPCKPGSSIWFMTETKDRHLVSEYWLSILGHNIEVEAHFAQINAWKAAPFTTYIVEQKVGDFLLIPPLAPHQVWNRGTRTMKAAWNRTTVETLEMALNEALPRARMVCRDEQYKNKAIVLFSLQRYSGLLSQVAMQKQTISDQGALMDLSYSPKIRQLQKDFKRLFALYTQVLLSEMPAPTSPPEKRMQYLPYDSFVTCSYCRCNIFNRFLTCTACIAPLANGEEDTYDICLECYAMGRSCRCLSKLKWVEQFPWKDLVEKHDLWRSQIIDFENGPSENSPKSLDEEKKLLTKRTLAEICQDQLKVRPWQDPKKEIEEAEVVEVESDEFNKDGTVKKRKKKKRRSEKWLQENVNCHICINRGPRWKHIICECGLAFCYGVLWRGFDMMPQTVMEDPDWKCPRCLKICSCTACRKNPENKPFEPTGTILGHDTRKFADPRSTESLVDFSTSNMHWIQKAGDDHPHETRRLRRRQDEAEKAKSRDPALNEHYVDDDDHSMPSSGESRMDGDGEQHDPEMPIDPMMLNIDPSLMPPSTSRPRRAQRPASTIHGKMRAPVANMVANQSVGAEPIQMAAMEALRVMDNPYQAYPGFGGGKSFQEGNGIVYEYPDPDDPPLSPQTTRYTAQQPPQDFMQPPQETVQPSQVDLQPPNETSHAGQKRKRASDRPMIRSDLVEVVTAPPYKKRSGARKEPQHVNTDTDDSNQRLIVKLHIDGSKLAGLERKFDKQRAAVGSKGHLHQQAEDSTIILSSDLPTNSNDIADPLSMYKPTKRRLKNDEKDDDFTTRKRYRTSGTGMELKARKEKIDYRMLSGSEAEDDEQETYTLNVSKSKRRSLPAYLARRSPVDESELPRELSEFPARRVSKTKEQTSSDSSTTNPSPIQGGHIPFNEAIINGHHASEEVSLPEPRDPPALVPNGQKISNTIQKGASNAKIPAKSTNNPVKVTQQDPSAADKANRQAKLKAVRWAQGDLHSSESSDSDSAHSPIGLTPPNGKTFKENLEAAKQRVAAPAGTEVRKSIFAKTRGGKVRITGAKTAVNGVKGKHA